ncbi:MAG: YggS family pyridoxal phosphate-dependent enzyme [Bacteroidales bacterium]|nr:YggS family pyridoxal phosphate-dependent enzyme [Bacteroidales bacterium]
MSIQTNLTKILDEIPQHVKLVAVSKTKPPSDIMEAYNTGHRYFGENKVQDLTAKQAVLPTDIQWHFIGHLQTNKVKFIAPFISLIESVDSLKLLKEINKQALKNDRTIDCLLQFHIAKEYEKFGLDMAEAISLLESNDYAEMQNIRINGLMGMATFTDDMEVVSREFKVLKSYFSRIKTEYFPDQESFAEISMGMSGDYQPAIHEGSTMVRIGSLIFGERKKSD